VTFTATVSPSARRNRHRTFMDGASVVGTTALNAGGVATFSISTLAVGTHSIAAQYSGDGAHTGSISSALSQTVNTVGTTTTLTSNPNPSKVGRPVTFTATVSSSDAIGTVQFARARRCSVPRPLNSGAASLTTSTLNGGKHSITATYSGDVTLRAARRLFSLKPSRARNSVPIRMEPSRDRCERVLRRESGESHRAAHRRMGR